MDVGSNAGLQVPVRQGMGAGACGFCPVPNPGAKACVLELNALTPKTEDSLVFARCSEITELKVCLGVKLIPFYLYMCFDFQTFFA